MKRLTIIISVLLFVFASAVIADHTNPNDGTSGTANINFNLPTGGIVYDVPFDVTVMIDSGRTTFLQYALTTTSSGSAVEFSDDGFTNYAPISIYSKHVVPGGRGYFVDARPANGGEMFFTNTYQNLFKVKGNIKKSVGSDVSTTINLDSTANNVIIPLQTQAAANQYTIISQPTNNIQPVLSTCGDGVVGYIDANNNGIKETNEVQEACDTALIGEGCSSDCSYIKATHKIVGTRSLAEQNTCAFGSRTCSLEQLRDKDKLLAKLNAIFDLPVDVSAANPSCFPYAGHPQITSRTDGAFCITREGPAQQFTPFLNALVDYYRVKRYIS